MKKIFSFVTASALALSASAVLYNSGADRQVVLTAFAEENTEHIADFSFDSGEDGWKGRGNASVASSSKEAYKGGGSLYCSGRRETWNGAVYNVGSQVTAGNSYSFSANVLSPKNSVMFHFTMQYDAGGETNYVKIASADVEKGEWKQLANAEFAVPSDAENISIYIETEKGTSDFYVDDVSIAPSGTVIEGARGSTHILGDVNNDGSVDVFDIIAARKLLISWDNAAPRKALSNNADVDNSTEYQVNDLVLLQNYLLGKIAEFPDNAPEVPVVDVSDEFTPFDYEEFKQYKTAPNDYFGECSQKGTVTKESYNGIRGNKSLYVYTPYNYDPSQKYNIFYLMHGGGENENTLFFQNDTMIQNMLDHMIMNGELEPLIVVTPTFNGQGSEAQNFYEELRQSVIPFVEEKYSTYAESTSPEDIAASRMHRAYGGFSMGSVSTWAVFKNDLDIVGYFMPLSGDHWGGNSPYEKAKSIADAVDQFGMEKNQFFIFAATGSEDIAYPNVNPQIDEMKKMSQFTFTSDFSKGNLYFMVAQGNEHWWGQVRHYVYDALPYFFHESGL